MMKVENELRDGIDVHVVLPWIEFVFWTAIALFPFLYWINGPAVSNDQFVMRTILAVVAMVGAIGLRFWNWRSKRQSESRNTGSAPENAAKSTNRVAGSSE